MFMRTELLFGVLMFAAAGAPGAQTGTPTTAPQEGRPDSRVNVPPRAIGAAQAASAETKKAEEDSKPANERTLEQQLRDGRIKAAVDAWAVKEQEKTSTIPVNPRAIAEFGIGRIRILKRMVEPEKHRDARCGAPADVEQVFRDATIQLSVADTDDRWRSGVVRAREGLERLRNAADTSYHGDDCGLIPLEKRSRFYSSQRQHA